MTREGDPQTREDIEKRLGELERADIADEIRKTEAGKTIQATLDSLKERKAGAAIPAPLLNSYFSPQNISPNTQQTAKTKKRFPSRYSEGILRKRGPPGRSLTCPW